MKKNAFVCAAMSYVAMSGLAMSGLAMFGLTMFGLTTGSAQAQSGPQDYASLTFPYEVTVDRTVLPAGEYIFRRVNATNNVLSIYSVRDAKSVGMFVAVAPVEGEPATHTEAVLKRIADRYYMEQLHMPGQLGFQLHVMADER